MRNVSSKGIELIKHFEGFVPHLYICPAGFPTIGYGHIIKKRDRFASGMIGEDILLMMVKDMEKAKTMSAISEEEACTLLKEDVGHFERVVLRNIHVPLTDYQFDALVSFVYNVGGAAFQRSTLRRLVNREQHESAAKEFMRWIWAAGQKSEGLVSRRKAEAIHYALLEDVNVQGAEAKV